MRFFSTDQDCCARTSPSGDRPTSGLSPPTLPLLRAAGRSAFDCTRPTRAGFVPVLVSINRGAVGRFLLRQSSEHILIVRAPGAGESPNSPATSSEAARCASTASQPGSPSAPLPVSGRIGWFTGVVDLAHVAPRIGL